MSVLSAALAFVLISTVSANYQEPTAEPTATSEAEIESEWGVLTQLIGSDWLHEQGYGNRFDWEEPGRVLVWYNVNSSGSTTARYMSFTLDPATGEIEGVWRDSLGYTERGPLEISSENSVVWTIGTVLRRHKEISLVGDVMTVRDYGRMVIPFSQTFVRVGNAPAASTPDTNRRGGPIIISGGTGASNPDGSAPDPDPSVAVSANASPSGPIIIAAAPPPAAVMREGPVNTSPAQPSSLSTREAQMQAQVEARRIQAAQEAEAERIRLAQIAEQRRQEEARRRAEQARREQERGEWLGMAGALVGGLYAGSYTDGDMTAITAGMAAGSAIAAPESEVAAAANTVFQEEYQRYEEQRAFEQQVIAELHNPDNPLTQQFAAEEEARRQQAEADRIEAETLEREAREEADRYALEQQRFAEREDYEAQAELDRQRAEDEARARQLREEEDARQREYEAEQRAREEEERRQEAERERLAHEEEERREAEARRLEQERIEAERTRLIDYREAVVICQLTGNQAQFGNWDCQGPLQQNYVNFERGNVDSAMNLMSCRNYRELPRSGAYRVFACGYGLHPTNPGAFRNVPEMMGIFVDGRGTFRCPANGPDICRDR
jgi:hypothetical protein